MPLDNPIVTMSAAYESIVKYATARPGRYAYVAQSRLHAIEACHVIGEGREINYAAGQIALPNGSIIHICTTDTMDMMAGINFNQVIIAS